MDLNSMIFILGSLSSSVEALIDVIGATGTEADVLRAIGDNYNEAVLLLEDSRNLFLENLSILEKIVGLQSQE